LSVTVLQEQKYLPRIFAVKYSISISKNEGGYGTSILYTATHEELEF
jgi:hypothetical protein